jgi:hypothetical protein
MLDTTSVNIESLSIHHIGNRTNGEEMYISKAPADITEFHLRELLLRYFLQPFTVPEYYSFTFSNEDFRMNPLYKYASDVFDSTVAFHLNSVNIARHLYETSLHPQIKAGDLFVVHFRGVVLEGKRTDALGIFKSENRQTFLKLDTESDEFSLQYEDGIDIGKMDKGCLIIDVDRGKGYRVCVIDKGNRNTEAQYWKDGFLQLRPCSDDYHKTREFLTIAKDFVTNQIGQEFEVTKADQIDYLNRSVDYFKKNENFDKQQFGQEVFQDKDLISSFRKFDETYRAERDMQDADGFPINPMAVKKQERVFKSVLKLDKNFHVYIHGDRSLIEQGREPDGRKFYKIYFEEES